MILFREEHVQPILAGTKTHTRHIGKRRWRVGATHQFRTRMLDKSSTFAEREILSVVPSALRGMTDKQARQEGYPSVGAYYNAFARIYGMATYMRYLDLDLDDPLWDVEFAGVPEHDDQPYPPGHPLDGV